jgi:hypothetical protein
MNQQTIAAGFLRGVGLLLIVLGLVHLAERPTFHQCWGKVLPVCTNEQWVRRCWITCCLGFSSCLWVTQPGLRRRPESQRNVGEASAADKRGRCADFSGIPGVIYAPA